ncbi:MAG TPA: dihydropteroate synthase [Bacteroidales bacterium]|nr:dihydropteroate synthase [Bacteroidales bacterium]
MQAKDTFFSRKLTINCGGELLDLSNPRIMGILNITPDSFYDGGKYTTHTQIIDRAHQMINEGCDILDIGAYSSRPRAKNISEKEEIDRLSPIIELIRKHFPDIILSIDTFRAGVAEHVIQNFRVQIINDISAGDMDTRMFEVVAKHQVAYIMMHMQGTPQNMQKNPKYDNVVKEVIAYFAKKTEELKLLGIHDLIIDPGFGFGKTIEHNYQLLKHLNDFKIFELPILAGLSRKSMICKLLNCLPSKALTGTSVLNTLALTGGANILRVHDVKEAKETILLTQKFLLAKVDNWYD